MTKVDTRISYIDNIHNIFIIFDQCFQIALENVIRTWSRQNITFTDCIDKLHFGKERLFCILM